MTRFEGSDALPVPEGQLTSTSAYLLGGATSALETPHYAKIRYPGTLPGIDIAFYSKEGEVAYDLEVAAGADPAAIWFLVEGADTLALLKDGRLEIAAGPHTFTHVAPALFSRGRTGKLPVEARLVL